MDMHACSQMIIKINYNTYEVLLSGHSMQGRSPNSATLQIMIQANMFITIGKVTMTNKCT